MIRFHWLWGEALVGKLAGLAVTVALVAVLSTSANAQTLSAGFVSGARGTSVWFDVTLDPQGTSIAATQNSIIFDRFNTPISTCVVNAELGKSLSFSLLPVGCSVGGVGGPACTEVRVLILSLTDAQSAITSPTVLYQCRADIPANATPNTYPLFLLRVSGSTPPGDPQPITGFGGSITVCPGPC